MQRWQRYWFAEGGRTSVAILRIAIAAAVWLSLQAMERSWPASAVGGAAADGLYRPVGLWMLVGDAAPSSTVIESLWLVARISTLAMLVGACSRVATAVSWLSSVALASLYYSGARSWSHEFNVVFLAQLAFLGARCGDVLSVDALIRRARGLAPIDVARGYQWSIRLVQLAVAVMFASAVFNKVWHGYPTLRWALSDNLRHQLLVRFDLARLERTAIADWLVDDAWRYRTAAMLNLVAQALPLAACFLMRRPVLRAACGLFFVVETTGLGLVMALWNTSWLPLAAVFIDWDALIAKVRRREASVTAPAGPWRPPRHIHAFIIAFVAFDLLTAFKPRIDQKLNTYPFSAFPMFSSIRARKPYDQHLPYSLAGGHFELVSTEPVPDYARTWIDHGFRKIYAVRDREELRRRLQNLLADTRAWLPGIQGVRCYYTIFEVPAYPERARVERRPVALLGELYVDGRFRSMLGKAAVTGGEVALSPGEELGTHVAIEHYVDARPEPREVHVGPPPWRYRRPSGKKIAFVAVVRDGDVEQRWLVASTPR